MYVCIIVACLSKHAVNETESNYQINWSKNIHVNETESNYQINWSKNIDCEGDTQSYSTVGRVMDTDNSMFIGTLMLLIPLPISSPFLLS